LVFTPDDKFLWIESGALGEPGRSVALYDMDRETVRRTSAQKAANCTIVDRGSTLVFSDADTASLMFETALESGEWNRLAVSLDPLEKSPIVGLVPVPATQAVVIGTQAHAVYLLRPATTPQLLLEEWEYDTNDPVAIAAGAKLVAIGDQTESMVRIVDPARPHEVFQLPVHDGTEALAFRPDPLELITVSKLGVIQRWPMTWRGVLELAASSTTVCLSPKERRIALQESEAKAQQAWLSCERTHGRMP
jgi:hypothetical protein